MNIPVWILTFNRPKALNRIIGQLVNTGAKNINVFSNHPVVEISEEFLNKELINNVIINTLNDAESNSWCTRSWNSIFLKNFKTEDKIICIQDDTTIEHSFGAWIDEMTPKYDFLWGPAGDQFFYATLSVFKSAGWWDERYLACFCGDADWMRRVYFSYDRNRMAIHETHQWGFVWNPCGIPNMVFNGDARQWNESKGGYINQCQEFERDGTFHPVLKHCQDHYMAKWGVSIDARIPDTQAQSRIPEIDWYPWFTKKYLNR